MKEISSVNTTRIDYLDIYRSVGIICMIMGHVGFGAYFDKLIHAFHMPMFFFLSGFLFNTPEKNSRKQYLIKKIRTLIIPYLIFGLLHYLIWILTYSNNENLVNPLLHLVWTNNEGLPISGALWFLTSLFFIYLIVLMIDLIPNLVLRLLIIIILSIFGCLETKLLSFRLPLSLGSSLAGLGVFYLARLLNYKKESHFVCKLFNLPIYNFLVLFIVDIIFVFMNSYINVRLGLYGNILLYYLNVFLSCILIINFSKYINDLGNKYRFFWMINHELKFIGKNSLIYMSFNQAFIILFTFIFSLIKTHNILDNFIILFFVFIILHFVSFLFENTNLRVLIGKKKKGTSF